MAQKKGKWTREELIIAFNLYCRIPFTKIHYTNPRIIEASSIIERSPSAVALKLVNFARLDPDLKKRNISGMKHGSKYEEIIWNEFHENWEELAFKSELLLANFRGSSIEQTNNIDISDLPSDRTERDALVKTRINQNFFRNTVLASYDNRCCITGISVPELLVAGHIVPWSIDKENRLNPKNGICLNALHDRAFDKGLITIDHKYKVILSPRLTITCEKDVLEQFFLPYDDQLIKLPQKFLPDIGFLKYHNNNIFIDN